jgi:hypothetical protein
LELNLNLNEKTFKELERYLRHSIDVKKEMKIKIDANISTIMTAFEKGEKGFMDAAVSAQYFDSLCQQLDALNEAEEALSGALEHEHDTDRQKAIKKHLKVAKDKYKRFSGNF